MASTPTRPGARRPAAGGPPSQAGKTARVVLSVDELRALPEFEESAEHLDLDPSNVSDGGFGAGEGTTVTITAAKFAKFEYPGRDDLGPQLRLFLTFQREGFDNPRVESMSFADYDKFTATKDGNHVNPRASAIKSNKDGSKYVPRPFKFNPGVMFLNSLVNAGLPLAKINAEGAAAFVGLVVHVRKQKAAGQNEDAKPALLVDYIDGLKAPAADKSVAPAKAAPAKKEAVPAKEVAKAAAATVDAGSIDVNALAEEALLDLLTGAPGNTITRAQIPTTLIQSAKWSKHENRGAILKLLRENDFIVRDDAPWTVADNSISL